MPNSDGNNLAAGVYSADIDEDINLVSYAGVNWTEISTVDHDTNLTVRSTFPLSTQNSEFMRLKIELK